MSARSLGWTGFDNLGTRVPGGTAYDCDGMPTQMGCGEQITVSRPWSRVGKKKSGWLVTYGLEPNTPDAPFDDRSQFHEDHDVVLKFCPRCAAVVEEQDKKATSH